MTQKDIENLSLLDYKFSELEKYSSENEYKKTYIYIDIKKELKNSPYFEKFIEDINSKKSITVSLVILYMKESNCQINRGKRIIYKHRIKWKDFDRES